MDAIGEHRLACLFDRLVDHQPDVMDERRNERTLTLADYRAAVIRDLRWLLNAARKSDSDDLYFFPEVAKSVLNYGARDLTGMTIGNLVNYDLEEELRQLIIDFEPRIIAETLTVRAVAQEGTGARIAFEINGHIWALPHPERMFLRTEMDLETGAAEITA